MQSINQTFFLTMAVIALGYIMKLTGLVTEDDAKSASRIVINITLPALLLLTVSRITLEPELFFLPVVALLVPMMIALVGYRVFSGIPRIEKGIALMASLGYNVGLFAFPIIEGIFGTDAIIYAAMFDIGNACIVFGLAYYLGSMHSPHTDDVRFSMLSLGSSLFRSIPFVCYIIGLALNVLSVELPVFVSGPLEILASSNRALVLIVLGMMLGFNFERSHWGVIGGIIGLRYGAGLLAGTLFYLFMPFDHLYRTVLFICMVLPMPLSVIPFSVQFGYDPRLSGTAANLQIIVSFFLIWGFLLITHTA
ncbi:MAG: AEC family transporter [Spirochaetota bacterium]